MWDAWASYDRTASGVIFKEKHTASNVAAARNEAISYAAYAVLTSRFLKAVGGAESVSQFADVMDTLCYPLDVAATEGDTPAAVGNRIAAAVLAYGLADGSNQANGYAAPDYKPVNAPLVVAKSGTTMVDPNRWQPLQLEKMISQNGIPVVNGVQQAIGPHWGHVKGFALAPAGDGGVPIDPGPPPLLGGDPTSDQAYKDQAVEVIRDSSQLDPANGATIDISPAVRGNNPLGSNGGQGHPTNPETGKPYEPNVVNEGDFARALTEFWADGPKSETPPGHWNVVANDVSDELGPGPQGRRHRSDGRSVAVGRQALSRAQRRDPRRGDRRLGPQGSLRLGPPDLDDPLHGRTRPVERPEPRGVRQGGPAARARPRRADHTPDDRPGWASRRAGRPRGRDRDQGLAGESQGSARPRPVASPGSSRSTGSRTSWRPS